MATWSDRLTKTDIKTVRKEVLPAAAKYYDLGIELSLDPDYLNTLTSKSDEENLRELLLRWLSGVDPEPTWKALCDALRNPAIKHELLAEEIEEKYCKVESKNTQEENGEEVSAVERSVIPVDSALTAHSETEIHTGDHNIISSLSTPTIESASWELSTQDSQPTLKSSSTKHVTSSSNKSPHKPKYSNKLGPSVTVPRHHGRDQTDIQLTLRRKPGPHPDPLPASYKQSKIAQEFQVRGVQESATDFSDNLTDVVDITMMVKPSGNQIKGSPKVLTGRGKSSIRRRSKHTRHRYLSDLSGLETGDRKMSLQTPRSKSLSVPQWNTAKYQGIEYKFLKQPDEDLFCQICGEVANEPHQTSCCSSLLCKSCVPEGECLICRKSGICKNYPDRRSNKRIQQMEVICPNAPHGFECDWIGELQDVPEHQQQECMRECILCAYSEIGCTELMYRSDIETHEDTHLRSHLDLSMKTVVKLVATIKQMQEQLTQQKSAIDCLTEEMKRLKMPNSA